MEEIISEEPSPQPKTKSPSHEPFFGVLVMMSIVIFLVLLASYGGWFLYHGVKNNMSDKNLLSIESIPMATSEVGNQETLKPVENKEISPESEPVNKKVTIKVLNGGAIKGSAGVVADLLKEALYTVVSIGNSTGDYTGISIYFTVPATQADADAVKEALLKKYPSVTVRPSVSGNADTSMSAVTVVIGK